MANFPPTGPNCYPISLVDADTGETLVLQDPAGGDLAVAISALSVGGPDVRAVINNRPNASGTIDTTRFFGAAAVTIAMQVMPTSHAHNIVTALNAWQDPRRRMYLQMQRTGWTASRRLAIRADQYQAPVVSPGPSVALLMSWRAVDGCYEDTAASALTLNPNLSSPTGGFSFPITFPFTFGTSFAPGSTPVTSNGTLPTPPVMDVYGPCTGPITIANSTTMQLLSFPALDIAAGDYVEINCANRTVLVNSDPTLSRLTYLDFTASTFWSLQPGENDISFQPQTAGAASEMILHWRDRRL